MAIDLWRDVAIPLVIGVVSPSIVGVWLYHKGQRDNAVEALIRCVDIMAEKGIEYWNTPEADPRIRLLSSQIKHISARIGLDLLELTRTYHSFRFCKKNLYLLTAFRKSITDGDFEVATRVIDANRGTAIEQRRTDIVCAIRRAKKII